jgi:hypothetical protein
MFDVKFLIGGPPSLQTSRTREELWRVLALGEEAKNENGVGLN